MIYLYSLENEEEEEDEEGDEYYVFNPSTIPAVAPTAGTNRSSVDISDNNDDSDDDDDDYSHNYLKLVPSASIDYSSNQK